MTSIVLTAKKGAVKKKILKLTDNKYGAVKKPSGSKVPLKFSSGDWRKATVSLPSYKRWQVSKGQRPLVAVRRRRNPL